MLQKNALIKTQTLKRAKRHGGFALFFLLFASKRFNAFGLS
jgi:hypothetical protein